MIWFILLAVGSVSVLGGSIILLVLLLRLLKRRLIKPGLEQNEPNETTQTKTPVFGLLFLMIVVGVFVSLLAIERIEAMP